MRVPNLKPLDEEWYVLTDCDGRVTETENKAEAKIAIREGREVFKNTRKIFQVGTALVRLAVTVEIKKTRDL